jgi:transglutaminase-like putative cysteine protease
VVLALLPWAAFGETSVSTFKTGTPPAWVEWAAPEAKTAIKSDQESGGQVLTLFDTQVNAAKTEAFVHVVKEITTEAGVQSGANLEFTWDPSFQELIIHQITIQRGTERMDRLDPAKFKIIQQETDLNRQIYNGALSALLFLEDVRLGDRIEYAYTVRGENPSLQGRYLDTFILGLAVPIQHRRIRLLWPEERELNFQVHGTIVEPEVRTHGGVKEYIWDLREVPAVVVEDQLPSWFQAYPWIQVSEFTSWAQVATWAAGLYVTTNLDAPELTEEIANLRHPGATAEQNVQGALEFTQKDIRYLGIEFGPNSYHPTDPVTVLRRRFGDCKDKAFLLCTLLRGLGYEATPVLVATGFRHTLPDLLPAPHDFDHVIVRVIADGATYWLDPTCSYQRGPITQRYLPEYSFGLLVQPGEMELTPVPFTDAGAPETVTTEIFRVGGQKAPTQLSATSTFKGFDAEWMRAVLTSGGRERLAKSYLNDYAQRYPGVMPAAPMVIEDSPDSDMLTVSHTYSITNFWVLSADKQRYNCQFYPLGIHTWITKPTTAVRSMPMELSFPRRRSIQTRIDLPREFKLSNYTNTIAGPAAELRVKRAYRGQTVWLDYEYTALTNFVPVSLTAEHLKSLDQMENALGYSLNWQNMDNVGSTSQFNWPIFLLGMIYAGMLSTGAGLLCRRQCRLLSAAASAQPPLLDQKLSGLGGWLILVGIGLVCGPLRLLAIMSHSLGAFSLWKWHALTNPGGVSYNPVWGPLLTLELLGQITILILNLFVLVLFFQKRRIFPRWFIALLVLNAIFILGDTIGVQFVKASSLALTMDLSRNLVQVFIGCGIWIPYMCLSRRVKTTFVAR